jgi:hypothetical protein
MTRAEYLLLRCKFQHVESHLNATSAASAPQMVNSNNAHVENQYNYLSTKYHGQILIDLHLDAIFISPSLVLQKN